MAEGCLKFLSYLLWELHPSRFCLFHKNWQSFSFTPWLPYSWKYQWLYIVYRWIVALFFFGWIFTIGLDSTNGEEKFFIFLTNWSYLLWVGHLLWSAASTTAVYFYTFLLCRKQFSKKFDEAKHGRHSHELLLDDKPESCCCGSEEDETFWHQKILWVVYNMAVVVVIGITILYWAILYDPDRLEQLGVEAFGPVNLLTHGVNGVIAFVDLFVTGIPFRLLHFIYPVSFIGVYAGFTGVYHAFNGTNVNGNPYVYSLIDYGEAPGTATGLVVAIGLVYTPLLYVIIYWLFLAREGLVHLVRKTCFKRLFADGKSKGTDFEMLHR